MPSKLLVLSLTNCFITIILRQLFSSTGSVSAIPVRVVSESESIPDHVSSQDRLCRPRSDSNHLESRALCQFTKRNVTIVRGVVVEMAELEDVCKDWPCARPLIVQGISECEKKQLMAARCLPVHTAITGDHLGAVYHLQTSFVCAVPTKSPAFNLRSSPALVERTRVREH